MSDPGHHSATIVRDGRTIAFEVIPGGPHRIVLVSGTGLPGAYWRIAQVPVFGEWASCLVVDNAGTGGTDPLGVGRWTTAEMALDVVAAMDAAGWASAHVAGHSLGSAIGTILALDHTTRVESLSLHSTWAGASRAPHLIAWLGARKATAAVGDSDLWMRYAFLLVSPGHFAEHGMSRGALGAVADLMTITRMGSGVHVGQYDAGLGHDATDRLAEIKLPTLVTVGERDFVTLPEHGRDVASAIAGAHFVELSDAGHLAGLEQPERFNVAQQAFIEAVTTGSM